ncbi:MAG: hypothetical protein Alpg2KO_17590 [Alphaproteobacteria bacterium]
MTTTPNMLDALHSLKQITPLIICGAARSGTRMMTDLINRHPEVAIQEEMHAKTIEAFFRFTEEVDAIFASYSERKGRPLEGHWMRSRHMLTHAMLVSANKSSLYGRGKPIRFHGIKTPGYERYFDQFDKAFATTPPRYIYCMRDPGKVWRSWQAMEYVDDYATFEARYIRSLRQANRIRRRAPDRLVVFDLEAYIAATDKGEHVARNILSPLGLDTPDSLRQSLSATENRNSLANHGRSYAQAPELEEQMAALRNNPKLIEQRDLLLEHAAHQGIPA